MTDQGRTPIRWVGNLSFMAVGFFCPSSPVSLSGRQSKGEQHSAVKFHRRKTAIRRQKENIYLYDAQCVSIGGGTCLEAPCQAPTMTDR
jgi:hypothetical protein